MYLFKCPWPAHGSTLNPNPRIKFFTFLDIVGKSENLCRNLSVFPMGRFLVPVMNVGREMKGAFLHQGLRV